MIIYSSILKSIEGPRRGLLCSPRASFPPDIQGRHKYAHHNELSRLWTSRILLYLLYRREVVIHKCPQVHIIPPLHHTVSLLNQVVSSQIWQSPRSGRCCLTLRPKTVYIPCNRHLSNTVLDFCIHPHQKLRGQAYYIYLSNTCIHSRL